MVRSTEGNCMNCLRVSVTNRSPDSTTSFAGKGLVQISSNIGYSKCTLQNYKKHELFIFHFTFYLVFLDLTRNCRMTLFVLIAGFFTQRHLLSLQNQFPMQSFPIHNQRQHNNLHRHQHRFLRWWKHQNHRPFNNSLRQPCHPTIPNQSTRK